jgi:hypothetical protein
MDEICLGYATVCFGALNDFGHGSLLERVILNNRLINSSGMAKFPQQQNFGSLFQHADVSYHSACSAQDCQA